jgi:hypothetical protein
MTDDRPMSNAEGERRARRMTDPRVIRTAEASASLSFVRHRPQLLVL